MSKKNMFKNTLIKKTIAENADHHLSFQQVIITYHRHHNKYNKKYEISGESPKWDMETCKQMLLEIWPNRLV